MERKLNFGRVVCQNVKANCEKRGREVRRITFKYDVPLEETMEFETVYHPNLQLDLADKREVWETPGGFFFWLFVVGGVGGGVFGLRCGKNYRKYRWFLIQKKLNSVCREAQLIHAPGRTLWPLAHSFGSPSRRFVGVAARAGIGDFVFVGHRRRDEIEMLGPP